MAAKKSTSIAKAQRQLFYEVPTGDSYLDLAKDLSVVNRKLFRQGYVYGIESIEFKFVTDPAVSSVVTLEAWTAGDTWSVHNAHVKGHALWNEMNQLVLEDNPSIKSRWHDFKVYLDQFQASGVTLAPLADGVPYLAGEWNYSDYVLPQHEVDPVSGLPLLADQAVAHLVGPDLGVPGNWTSVGLVNAYQESRATVQPNDPNVPVGFGQSFFNLLTDSGSQEPELADVIRLENDNPPYDLDNYPGGAINAPTVVLTDATAVSAGSPQGVLGPFVAQCGLVKLENKAYLNGAPVTGPALFCIVTLMPGKYKGVAAFEMGQ